MDLAFHDHRIDAHAAIIERVEPSDLGDAAVDIDDADIGAERIGHVRRVTVADRLEPGLHAGNPPVTREESWRSLCQQPDRLSPLMRICSQTSIKFDSI